MSTDFTHTIAEMREGVGATNLEKILGLYVRKDGKIAFVADFSSPEPSDVSYSYGYEFERAEYDRGMTDLDEGGHCVLTDRRPSGGGTLEVVCLGGAIQFNLPRLENRTNDLYPTSFTAPWTLAQIVILS